MPYSILRNLKKEKELTSNKIVKKNLIVGNDLYALEALYQLLNLDDSLLLSSKKLAQSDFSLKGPCTLRGEKSVELLNSFNLNSEIKSKHSLFYKDQGLRSFDSRFRSQALYPSESYFTLPRAELNFCDCFKTLNLSSDLQVDLLKKVSFEKIKSIRRLEDFSWQLLCDSGMIYEAENLYLGLGAYSFFSLLENFDLVSPVISSALKTLKAPSKLFVSWVLPRKISEIKETLFFPLSLTYESGHFIGEFSFNLEGQQTLEFVHFFDPETVDEEELSKRIRLLKKTLRKVFPDFETLEYQGLEESINYIDDSPIDSIDDKVFESFLSQNKNLFFIGENALLRKVDPLHVGHLGPFVRALSSLSELSPS